MVDFLIFVIIILIAMGVVIYAMEDSKLFKKMLKSLTRIEEQLTIHNLKQNQMSAILDQLNAKVDKLQSDLDAKQAAIAAAIQALKDQIANGGVATEADLQAVIDKLDGTDADLNSTPTE